MARKATTEKAAKKTATAKEKTVKEKKPRKKKAAVPARVIEYDSFIKTTLYGIIRKEIPEIKRICESVEGIETISDDNWLILNKICIEVSEAMKKEDYESYFRYDIFETRKRVKCGLTEKVREAQTRRFVNEFIKNMSDDDNHNIHICKQIYTHIAIWIESETKKVVEKKDKEKKAD